MRRAGTLQLVIESHVQQADLEAVVADQVDQLRGIGSDGLLVQQHEEAVEPFRGQAVGLRCQGQKDDFFVGR
jgi:hypothetical protein